MKLQTQLPLLPQENQIDYSSKVLLLGSCFAENIGKKLEYFKFNTLQNPFGILFQPPAIQRIVERAIIDEPFTEKDIFFFKEQWRCFEVSSSLSNLNKKTVLNNLNNKNKQLLTYLKEATHIVFTYGTSWIYKHIETNVWVANCHKIPQKKFKKEILSIHEIEISIKNTISLIQTINPTIQIITTVSPIRHIKDGFTENTRSKAHLITAIHQFIKPQYSSLSYFPSFEIMMDELRDYRFYKEDMLHPNSTAITILWKAFNTMWISSKTEGIKNEIDSIQKSLLHKPFNLESKEHQLFLKNLQKKIKAIQEKNPKAFFNF